MKHDTKETIIKTAPIDIKMIPIIKWLNSFDSVYTVGCCEGGTGLLIHTDGEEEIIESEAFQPTANFMCTDHLDLATILSTIENWWPNITCKIRWAQGAFYYSIKWDTQEYLNTFTKDIQKWHPDRCK